VFAFVRASIRGQFRGRDSDRFGESNHRVSNQCHAKAKGLTAAKVAKAKAGRYGDGGGLYLLVRSAEAQFWIFRYVRNGKMREMGLGPAYGRTALSLVEARKKARALYDVHREGRDPLAERDAARAALQAETAKAQTFRQCTGQYLNVHGDKWKNPKHAAQWRATLETYAHPIIGNLSAADIDEAHLVKVLQPIWKKIPETARRVRGRIEAVLGYATVSKFRSGDNPARWRNHLQTLLGGTQKPVEHHAALPFLEAPAFMAELRARKSTSAVALEFLILTAARTGEVIGARWDEINFKDKTWTVPAERMKAKTEHRVPLAPRAIEILKGLERRGEYIFNGAASGGPLSNMAMLELMRGLRPGFVPHGFRSMFRDWAAERTSYPNHVIEMALAHTIPDKVEKAYRRGDLFEKRRKLMDAWAKYCSSPAPAQQQSNVVSLREST
jgi:integrase